MKILVVCGQGRIGSTILSLALGQHSEITAVGELFPFQRRLGEGEAASICGCGEDLNECSFWKEALGRESRSPVDIDALCRTEKHPYMRLRNFLPFKRSIYGGKVPKVLDTGVCALQNLLGNIKASTGCEVMVDSSKTPNVALLYSLAGYEVYTLHLVRDSRGVLFSWLGRSGLEKGYCGLPNTLERIKRIRVPRTALEYWLYNCLSEQTAAVTGNYLRLRYEDFASDPQRGLARIFDYAGVEDQSDKIFNRGKLQVGPVHFRGGNPARFNVGEVPVSPDTEWRRKMGRTVKWITGVITWPMLLRYGYLTSNRKGGDPTKPAAELNRLRVLYVITELNEGGAENSLWEVARGLHVRGHAVKVVALYDGGGDVGKRLREAGIEVEDLQLKRPREVGRILRLRQIVKEFAPNIVNSWLFHANFLCRFVVPRKTPLLCSLRVCEPRQIHTLLERLTKWRVSGYIGNSQDVVGFARGRLKVPASKRKVIYSGVDATWYAPARRTRRNDTVLRGLTLARIVPQKGVDILLRAMARLPRGLEWEWTFAGEAPDKEYLAEMRRLAEAGGIADRVIWTGKVARRETLNYYRNANLFALPSRWEGLPNVVLEAMAAGLPVMAAVTDGILELLKEKKDCLIPVSPNRPDAWAQALTVAWEDKKRLEAGVRAGTEIIQVRGWRQTVEKHLAVYREMRE